jgi:RHS repeat-associated protein
VRKVLRQDWFPIPKPAAQGRGSLHLDEPICENGQLQVRSLRSATTSFYEADGLGTVTSLSNTSGAPAQTYRFDSFGKQTASNGSLTNPFQYTGREFDPETSLYYYRARYYDPSSGRFLSEDQVGNDEGVNLYGYVNDSPINSTDPTGFYALKGFSVQQQNQMNTAIRQAISKLIEKCPSCAGPDAMKIIHALATATYVYKPNLKDCGETWHFGFLLRHIDIGQIAFDPNKCCTLASTLTHEASHLGAATTDKDKPGNAYQIEKDCFGCGTGHPPPKPPRSK